MIHPSNTLIIWGSYTINEMFNVISIGKPPSESIYTQRQEILPNGKSRKIATVNSENDFSITVDGGVVNRENFLKMKELFEDDYTNRMRLVNATTGEVLVEYKSTILANINFLENIDDGSGTNAILTFNCINEL